MNIKINDLTYTYGKTPVLKMITTNLNLDSKCISLIGHNGAGKSTLLNIICGILNSKTDRVVISDDIDIAYLPFDNPIYDQFSVEENLMFWFQLYNEDKFDVRHCKVQTLIRDFKLGKLLNQKVEFLSSGEKRKVGLACILLGTANLIVLDEPFNGLDVASRVELCNIINKYKKNNISFIISSHQLEVLNTVSDHTLILKNGELVYDLSSEEMPESIINTYVDIYE